MSAVQQYIRHPDRFFIGGEWVEPSSKSRIDVRDSATEEVWVAVVRASIGFGRSIAVGLGRRGADVALLARRCERPETAAAEIGSRATTFPCDVTSRT